MTRLTGDMAFDPSETRRIIDRHAGMPLSAGDHARCPRCLKTASSRQDVEREFGFRNMDGTVRTQSWCKACRSQQGRRHA